MVNEIATCIPDSNPLDHCTSVYSSCQQIFSVQCEWDYSHLAPTFWAIALRVDGAGYDTRRSLRQSPRCAVIHCSRSFIDLLGGAVKPAKIAIIMAIRTLLAILNPDVKTAGYGELRALSHTRARLPTVE